MKNQIKPAQLQIGKYVVVSSLKIKRKPKARQRKLNIKRIGKDDEA